MKQRRVPCCCSYSVWFGVAAVAVVLFASAGAGRAQAQAQAPPGPLSKAHAALVTPAGGCEKCHVSPGKTDAALCLKCHQPIAQRIAAKRGVHRDVTGECAMCHQEHQGADVDLRPLDPKSFDHGQETGFPLVGAHASAAAKDCATCHKTRSYLTNTPDCASCHQEPHGGALGKDCSACHTPVSGFNTASRAFHKAGLFPLQGKHLSVPCASCHWNGATKGTPTKCYDCHWIRRQDDRYRTRLGNQCENCHTPTAWTMVRWNHASATGVRLNATHTTLQCDSCHKDQTFRAGAVACVSCHQDDYQRTASPNHAAAGFPTACEACHRPSDSTFRGATFSHNTVFQLVGAHATQPCAACHKNNVYRGTPRDCYACHQADYQRAQNPNHVAAGFPTTCDTCHKNSAPSFSGAGFNHASAFALVGDHATQPCAACHRNNVYRGTPRDCYGCHQANYQQTTSPNHAAAGFPTTCDACHRPTDPSFRGASFNHSTVFALVGVHATQPCAACHRNNVYRGTPRDCYPCHQANYQQTTSPNHVAAGFPTTCDTCHRPTDPSFRGASFNHSTVFALVGVHATQPCAACHINNVYRGTPRVCVGCHQANYQQAQNPNHIGAGFSTTCDQCHLPTDATWQQGRFNHTAFPITSGRHSGNRCSVCHVDPTNYRVFSCTVCHDRARTDSIHQGRSGYRYDSTACYACHPRGEGG